MKRTLLLTTATTLLFGTAAMAAVTVESVVSAFQADGYENIEVKEGPTQIKVEASRGADKIEIVYDKASGVDPGIDISRSDRDFEDDDEGDDEDDDDEDDENDDDEDDDEDDDSDEDDDEDDDSDESDDDSDESDDSEDDARQLETV
ncbi:MAG: PepSY domain-containing protein [Rhodobacteraceae bacterium]|nr:PepSY domain-containing protein [Paracoccaceae bacterium]